MATDMHTSTPEIKKLMDWIDSHCLPEATKDNGDGTLTVAVEAVKDGVVFIERDIIPAKLRAARDWLGY